MIKNLNIKKSTIDDKENTMSEKILEIVVPATPEQNAVGKKDSEKDCNMKYTYCNQCEEYNEYTKQCRRKKSDNKSNSNNTDDNHSSGSSSIPNGHPNSHYKSNGTMKDGNYYDFEKHKHFCHHDGQRHYY